MNPTDARQFKPGDILDATFHYSAQIPKFYVVTRNTGKTIYAEEIGKRTVSCDRWGQNGQVVPDPEKRTGRIESSRIRKGGYIRLNDSYTRIWGGRPVDFYTD